MSLKPNATKDLCRLATVKQLLDLTSPHWTFIAERPVYLALSGGKDSVVLLDAIMQQWPSNAAYPLTLLHVNHHLQTQSSSWADHCVALGKRYGIACVVLDVAVSDSGNIEANAREARYTALFSHMAHDGVLLLGQHANDQVETLFINLKRGAGSQGLSGMAVWQTQFNRFGAHPNMALYRPLLGITQAQIDSYALHALHPDDWVEDPSNQDIQYDRNFLRHEVLPKISQRWPQWVNKVAHSMQVLNQEQALLLDATNEKLATCLRGNELSLSRLVQFSAQWQTQLLRLYAQRYADIVLSQLQLRSLEQVLGAKSDAQGQLSLVNQLGQKIHFFRYQAHLYCVSQASLDSAQAAFSELISSQYPMESNKTYQAVPLSYKIKPCAARHHKPIKQWYQLWSVPPWMRPFTLVLQHNSHDELLWCNGVEYILSKD
jgi:tRNA(Ile)-lysidine synthase